MKVIEFIKENGLEALQDRGIDIREYPDIGVVVLNYNQINAKKSDPIAGECRALALEMGTWKVVRRLFDRFFNLGEMPDSQKEFDITRAVAMEKVDGSLIGICKYNGKWYAGTKKSFDGNVPTSFNITFFELVLRALGLNGDIEFQEWCEENLIPTICYAFELTAPENMVVKVYDETQLHYLAARSLNTNRLLVPFCGNYTPSPDVRGIDTYQFNSMDEMKAFVSEELDSLETRDEGLVLYDPTSEVFIKIKTESYLRLHRMRGECTPTPRMISEMIFDNEHGEFLTYFESFTDLFRPYIIKAAEIELEYRHLLQYTADIEDKKELAHAIKDSSIKHLVFANRAGKIDDIRDVGRSKFTKMLLQELGIK